LTTTASAAAGKVLDYLKTPAARAIFDKHGFTIPGRNFLSGTSRRPRADA
jgi:hypothetical protein